MIIGIHNARMELCQSWMASTKSAHGLAGQPRQPSLAKKSRQWLTTIPLFITWPQSSRPSALISPRSSTSLLSQATSFIRNGQTPDLLASQAWLSSALHARMPNFRLFSSVRGQRRSSCIFALSPLRTFSLQITSPWLTFMGQAMQISATQTS